MNKYKIIGQHREKCIYETNELLNITDASIWHEFCHISATDIRTVIKADDYPNVKHLTQCEKALIAYHPYPSLHSHILARVTGSAE